MLSQSHKMANVSTGKTKYYIPIMLLEHQNQISGMGLCVWQMTVKSNAGTEVWNDWIQESDLPTLQYHMKQTNPCPQ